MLLATTMTALLGAPAAAESAGTLPAGAQVFYAGAGASSFGGVAYNEGAAGSDGERDRYLQLRLDSYYARGLSDRIQLSAWLNPLAAGLVFDTGGLPCPGLGDSEDPAFATYCDAVISAGELGVQGRYRALDGPVVATLGLAAVGDPWNAGSRGNYTAIGRGALGLAPGLYLGRDFHLGALPSGILAFATYTWRLYPLIGEGPLAGETPTDLLVGGLEWRVGTGDFTWQLGLSGSRALGGLLWDETFAEVYWPSTDRWLVIRDSYLRVEGKASYALSERSGLHLALGRVFAAVNTPDDLVDLSLGVHVYRP